MSKNKRYEYKATATSFVLLLLTLVGMAVLN